jgi:hypothetical protein
MKTGGIKPYGISETNLMQKDGIRDGIEEEASEVLGLEHSFIWC